MSTLTSQDRALYDDGTLSMEGLWSAWERKDPRLAEYLIKLVALDPAPAALGAAAREQKPNYISVLNELTNRRALKQRVVARDPAIPGQKGYSRARRQRVIGEVYHELFAALETEETAAHLPDRFKTYALIEKLWDDGGAFARSTLLQVVSDVPLKWGPWRGMKRIFKGAIQRQDWEVFAALTVRLEQERTKQATTNNMLRAPLLPDDNNKLQQISPTGNASNPYWTRDFSWDNSRAAVRDIDERTIAYLLRRAYRAMKALARSQPAAFPFVAAELLCAYPAHIAPGHMAGLMSDEFAPLWAQNSTPLMQIAERAQNGAVLSFAFSTLELRFRDELKAADPAWILRLVRSPQRKARRLAVRWFLEPLCGHEQGRFHEVGLQDAVLDFLDYSDDKQTSGGDRFDQWEERSWLDGWYSSQARGRSWPQIAREYALDYIKASYKVVADSLPLEKVMWLLRHDEKAYRDLGEFLLYPDEGRSPYDAQLDLAFWTELLEDSRTFMLANRAIRTKFSGAELSADWYAERLLSKHKDVRELATQFLRDETKYRVDDDWLGFHKRLVRAHEAQEDILQRSLYQLARRDDDGNSLLDDLSVEFLRMLLVHPKAACHQAVIGWCEGGRIAPSALGVAFLRELSTKTDWEARGWLSFLGDEREDAHEKVGYIAAVGTAVRRWLRTAASLAELGYGWVLERVERFDSSYDFVRDLYRREMPFARLAADPDAEDAAAQGLAVVLEAILEEKDANSTRANFYKSFLLSRHPLARQEEDPNLPPLADGLALPRAALDFSWFERMAVDAREPIRTFAMKLADHELARWTDDAPLTFPRLRPLLRDAYTDIRRFLVRAITAPLTPEGRLDVERPQFKVEELYAYCFDSSRDLRELGMEIIVRLPERFGQPAQLLLLSESTDRRVRELVIQVIWRQFRMLPVTADWQPFERSVVPQSLSLAKSQRVVALPIPPPDGMAPGDVKSNRKYLGLGVSRQSEVQLSARDAFEGFVRSVLFQLPPVRQSPKLPARPQPLETAWRNKRTLIVAVRDLAVRDREFAEFILPILKEFQNVRGKMVRDACLTALAYIQMAQPELSALGDNA